MARFEIADPADPRIADYRGVRDPEWLHRRGLFIAEGRDVVARCLASGRYRLRSVLATPTSLDSLAAQLVDLPDDVPLYAASRAVIEAAAGVGFHQGCVAAGLRPEPTALRPWLAAFDAGAGLVLLDDVTNPDNVGSVFRNALAFGAAGVVLTERSAHPLYRKAARTSIGAVFGLPWTLARDAAEALRALGAAGHTRIALTPERGGLDLEQLGAHLPPGPWTLVLGHEGHGLSAGARAGCDLQVRIPVRAAAESLNVATASGIALYWLARLRPPGPGID